MAHLLARAVCANEKRKRRFKLGISAHQRVVFGIADLGRILRVIQLVVPRDRARKPHQFVGRLSLANPRRIHCITLLPAQ